MSELLQFFDAYAENDLTSQEREEFLAWMRKDDSHVDLFVRESFLHAQLFSIARQKSLHTEVMEAQLATEHEAAPAPVVNRAAPQQRQRAAKTRRLNPAMLALAASLAVVTTLAVWSLGRSQAVGQLTQATGDAAWENPSNALQAGAFLYSGQQLRLQKGRVLATLASGARIVLEGPARLRVDGGNQVRLEAGRIGAIVPPQAIGFTVETRSVRVVDLGTEFTLDLEPDGDCRLFVFSGLVEMQPAGDPQLNPPFKVPQTRGMSYDAATGVARIIPFEAGSRLSPP